MLDDALRDVLERLHGGLETLPYHEFLGVGPDARGDELRRAFHERAKLFHPDTLYGDEDEATRDMAYAVYKRVTEAYRVLSDPALREAWEEARATGAVRLDRTERPTLRPGQQPVTNPAARKYYVMALESEQAGDKRGARLNLDLALQLEPGNAILKKKLEDLRAGDRAKAKDPGGSRKRKPK